MCVSHIDVKTFPKCYASLNFLVARAAGETPGDGSHECSMVEITIRNVKCSIRTMQ